MELVIDEKTYTLNEQVNILTRENEHLQNTLEDLRVENGKIKMSLAIEFFLLYLQLPSSC